MKVSVRSGKMKLPKDKNEDERQPESEKSRWRFMHVHDQVIRGWADIQ